MAPYNKPSYVPELANAHQYDASERQPHTPAHGRNPFKNHRT